MCVMNVTDYDNMTDDYNITSSSNCTFIDNNFDLKKNQHYY